jgi:hypothetical protein
MLAGRAAADRFRPRLDSYPNATSPATIGDLITEISTPDPATKGRSQITDSRKSRLAIEVGQQRFHVVRSELEMRHVAGVHLGRGMIEEIE